MKTHFAFILTSALWLVQSVESTEKEKSPSMVVHLKSYELCHEGKTNVVFGNIILNHGAKKRVNLTYDFKTKWKIEAPVKLEAIMSAKNGEEGDYTHQLSPKKSDFCPSLDDKDDVFAQVMGAIGLKNIACPVPAKKWKIKNHKFVMPKKAADALTNFKYWNITTIFRTERNENEDESEMCLILYLELEQEEQERERNFNKDEKKEDEDGEEE